MHVMCSRIVLLSIIVISILGFVAHAQTFGVIYNFTGQNDGAYPEAGVTVDRAGNLYCTTEMGGTSNRGTACKLTRAGSGWTFKSLYSFGGPPDASAPIARVVIGPDGALYGTTEFGGHNCGGNAGCGTVYKLQPHSGVCTTVLCPWMETLLYVFNGDSDGANPGYGDLVFDAAGNIYGTTFFGGSNANGVVFELKRSGNNWTENPIYTFAPPGGLNPYSGVMFDSAGNLYGTTSSGGSGYGTVYKLSPSGEGWSGTTLYSFQLASSGGNPYGGVIVDSLDNLYGGTSAGGPGSGGTVYELTSSGGTWSFSLLYGLTGTLYQPGMYSNLTMDAAGNLYGTAEKDGANSVGTIFKLTPSGGGYTYTSLHDFSGESDGAYPVGGVSIDASGNLYGTAKQGGAHGYGVIWQITP